MIRPTCALLVGLLLAVPCFAATPPPITGDEGATYKDLIREKKLVTIMLKDGTPEHNMRIKAIHPEAATPTIEVETTSGERTAHTFANVDSVRVQRERIKTADKPDPENVLTADDKKIVDQATDTALGIFKGSRNQLIRMNAATVLAASTHAKKADAIAYLKDLSASNDVPTALLASMMLWEVGEAPKDSTLLAGLTSGNRGAKALAAALVGLTKANQFIVELRGLLRDPAVEVFPSAAVALGRLNDRTSLPVLFETIRIITNEKAEAAVTALSIMGGPDVIQKLQEMLPNAKGAEWFRIVRTLHALGDKNATHLLETEGMSQPGFQKDTALLLAGEGDPEALKFLRDFLNRPYDPDAENLIYRAAAALAIYSAGDISAKGKISDVLNIQPNDIYARSRTSDKQYKEAAVSVVQSSVSQVLGKSMRRDLLPLLVSPLQSPDPSVAVLAARAIVSISNHDFAKRTFEFAK